MDFVRLKKTSVIAFFGNKQGNVAEALGIKQSSVSCWPDVLSSAISDRVRGACLRLGKDVPSDWLINSQNSN